MDTRRRPSSEGPRWQSRSGGSAGVGPRPEPPVPPPHVVLGERLSAQIDALLDRVEQLEREVATLREVRGDRGSGEETP